MDDTIGDTASHHRPLGQEKRREQVIEREQESQSAPTVRVRRYQLQSQA